MRVGYVQSEPIFGNRKNNFHQIQQLIKNERADLIVLPELFATGYAFQSKEEAEQSGEPAEDGPTSEFLIQIAKQTGAVVVGGFIEKTTDTIYNAALMVSKDGVIDTYRKIHLFYKEKMWFSPGNKHYKVYNIRKTDAKIGMMVCFDWIFPEVTRTLAKLGADIIAHPANLVLPYCQKAMVTRCLSNRVFAVTANRIGKEKRGEDDFQFSGLSQITAYNGEILASAPIDSVSVGFVDIDVKKARNKFVTEYNNVFQDRRTKYYKLD
ncbi:MAG: nitrilase-related carbon-nitrogen hydrolase [Candidatus Hermodarchaeota archaeon]